MQINGFIAIIVAITAVPSMAAPTIQSQDAAGHLSKRTDKAPEGKGFLGLLGAGVLGGVVVNAYNHNNYPPPPVPYGPSNPWIWYPQYGAYYNSINGQWYYPPAQPPIRYY
jgi:hypothetical protein